VIAKVRAICMKLDGTVEEKAWVGVRWTVKRSTYAHVLEIKDGKPAAFAKAAGRDGVVLVFRASEPLAEALGAMPGFFRPVWSTRWGTKVVGMFLDDGTDWKQVKRVLTDAHALFTSSSRRRS
jgi:hypothetical protein